MLDSHSVKTAVNTAAASPLQTEIDIPVGLLTEVSIGFPAGCAGLVGVRILRGVHQLWPLTPGEWFVTDDFIIQFPERLKVETGMNTLTIETYNTDLKYAHTLTLGFHVAEPAPDPLRQIAELIARRELSEQDRGGGLGQEPARALIDIRDLLYVIHSNDLPMIYDAILMRLR